MGPEIPGRNDLDDPEPVHAIRVIERKPIADARAPVVAEDMCAGQIERIHQTDDIQRHLAFGIGAVFGIVRGNVAFAVTAQIGDDDVELLGQRRGDLGPAHVVLRISVKQDQPRALACLMNGQAGAIGGDHRTGEAGNV